MCNLHEITMNAMISTKWQMLSSFITRYNGPFQDLIGQATHKRTHLSTSYSHISIYYIADAHSLNMALAVFRSRIAFQLSRTHQCLVFQLVKTYLANQGITKCGGKPHLIYL